MIPLLGKNLDVGFLCQGDEECYQNEDKSIFANNHQTIERAKVTIEETNCKKNTLRVLGISINQLL
jgi:hypothetical protein